MANQITDTRTLVDDSNTLANYVGSTSPSRDSEIYMLSNGSIGEQMYDSTRWVMYNAGSPQDWSNNVFYVWINCGIVGLLDTKALGGFRIRFAGASTTDFFEVYIAGSDEWPTAIAGGWSQFVVDIEEAALAANTNGWTGGTPPATTAIQHVGWAGQTAGTKPRNADNTWMSGIWRLPYGSPGITIEGQNGGTTPWTFPDIYTQLTFRPGCFVTSAGGAWKCNTPIQIGNTDGTTHVFSDSNELILWDNPEYVTDNLFALSAVGNTSVTMGIKSGTGDAATASQGVTFQAASDSWRFNMDFNAADLDAINLYGCTFNHGGSFFLDSSAVSCISSFFIDCQKAYTEGATDFLRNNVIDADTVDGDGFVECGSMDNIKYCNFEFSNGHAIEITLPFDAVQASVGNLFTGYGGTPGSNLVEDSGSTDAAIYNDSGNAITIGVSGAGDTPSVRNGNNATTTVTNTKQITLTGLKDNTEVRVFDAGTTTELHGTENATTGGVDNRSFAFNETAGANVDIRIINKSYEYEEILNYVIPNNDAEIPIQQSFDRVYNNP